MLLLSLSHPRSRHKSRECEHTTFAPREETDTQRRRKSYARYKMRVSRYGSYSRHAAMQGLPRGEDWGAYVEYLWPFASTRWLRMADTSGTGPSNHGSRACFERTDFIICEKSKDRNPFLTASGETALIYNPFEALCEVWRTHSSPSVQPLRLDPLSLEWLYSVRISSHLDLLPIWTLSSPECALCVSVVPT